MSIFKFVATFVVISATAVMTALVIILLFYVHKNIYTRPVTIVGISLFTVAMLAHKYLAQRFTYKTQYKSFIVMAAGYFMTSILIGMAGIFSKTTSQPANISTSILTSPELIFSGFKYVPVIVGAAAILFFLISHYEQKANIKIQRLPTFNK
jgi:hypothetical protein